MIFDVRSWQLRCFGAFTAMLLLATVALAGETRQKPIVKAGESNPNAQTVEMFAAIEKGDIAVKLIPKDSTQSNILIENKTDQPLNVKLPEAFAGVPVLAQAAAGGGGRGRGSSGSSGSQGTGGGRGGGSFNVPAESVGKINVPTVCLDYGKREPQASVPYEIKPIESYTTKPGVRELCEMLGSGQIDQRAAQAAAWHLNNNMSWEQLTAKRLQHANGTSRPYFSQQEIQTAMRAAGAAVTAAKAKEDQHPAPSSSPRSSKTKSVD